MVIYFYYEVKVKGLDLGHYPAKLLKRITFIKIVLQHLKIININGGLDFSRQQIKLSKGPVYKLELIDLPLLKQTSQIFFFHVFLMGAIAFGFLHTKNHFLDCLHGNWPKI